MSISRIFSSKTGHWTFWHSVPATSCDCETHVVHSFDVLSEQDIMKMYSELVRPQCESSNRKNYYKSYRKRVRQSETPEQIYQRRESDRFHKASVKQTETPEQTSKRKESNRQYKASLKQAETDKQTADRRENNRQCKKTSRTQETPEQTKQRQQIDKIKTSQTRLVKKLKVETIDDAMNNFKAECKKQPIYICTSCHRLLWRKGVQKFSMHKYDKIKN